MHSSIEYSVNLESIQIERPTLNEMDVFFAAWNTSDGFRISPRGGAWTLQGGGVNTQFCRILPKTAWNWKNLDAEGGGGGRASLTPPLRSATEYCYCNPMRSTLIKFAYLELFSTFQICLISQNKCD